MKSIHKVTERQVQIAKLLIEANVKLKDVAAHYGHTPQNASLHKLRGNVDYFRKAIKEKKKLTPTG